jgi:L-rhamnose mutarotase
MIIKVKPEYMKDYVELHKNAWPEILDTIGRAGAEELVIFKWGCYSIVFFVCDDLNAFYEKYGEMEVTQRWNALTRPWFDESPNLDGTGDVANLEKIFDFSEQLEALN